VPITRGVTSPLRTFLAPLALAVAVIPFTAGPADAKAKHRRHATKHATTKVKATRAVATSTPVATPAPAPAAPAVTSVISIGGYVFYNLTYAEAVAAYQAAVAAAPPGYTPAPVTSISVSTTVGGTAG
jgi:hypothetical protein